MRASARSGLWPSRSHQSSLLINLVCLPIKSYVNALSSLRIFGHHDSGRIWKGAWVMPGKRGSGHQEGSSRFRSRQAHSVRLLVKLLRSRGRPAPA
jgi:hypothetical protein